MITPWSLLQIKSSGDLHTIVATASQAGFDSSSFKEKFEPVIQSFNSKPHSEDKKHAYDIVIVGAGAAGISVASSLLSRKIDLRIALIDPAETRFYKSGFTVVGGGVFHFSQTHRSMERVIPVGVSWINASVIGFTPEVNTVFLANGISVGYNRLVVRPSLILNRDGIKGLSETLGKNSVCFNYDPTYSEYTWKLVQEFGTGKAIFTQPAMPIKCAGTPQKALYLSADHWFKNGTIDDIDIEFYNADAVLFGVNDYVPALQSYAEKYREKLNFNHKLVKIDGLKKTAWFDKIDSDGNIKRVDTQFNMIHVYTPQSAPEFIRTNPLVDDAGWVDVDQQTHRHKKYTNIRSLGDIANTPNAKTIAAVRKQAPVVACNILSDINSSSDMYEHDGYGSCPLTIERGKIVLAEFTYDGKVQPSIPCWINDGTKATRFAWLLKVWALRNIYWHGMLRAERGWLSRKLGSVSVIFY